MGDTPMPDAAEAPPAGEKATLDRNVSSDEDSDDEEIGENISASLEIKKIEIPEWNDSKPIEEQMLDLCYNTVPVQTCDFLSEFGAAEQFLLDGESLVAWALSNPLLDKDNGGSTLHVAHIVETALANLKLRGAQFEVFFFEGYAPLWRTQGDLSCMTRELIISHLSLAAEQAKVDGRQEAVKVRMLPGGWWMAGQTAAWDSLLESYGPAFIMTDYGWCGEAKNEACSSITRGFVHHCHSKVLNVVTIADLNMDGSHAVSANMQPPAEPLARKRFDEAMAMLLSKHSAVLSAQENAASNVGVDAKPDGLDSRELLIVAAIRKALTAAKGKNTQDLAALFCSATALAQQLPLSQRAFAGKAEDFQAWRKGSELASEARDFLAVVARAATAVLRLPENQGPLKAGIAKGKQMRIADAIDGRLFALVLMRACTSGELGLSPEVAAAAQKMAKAAGVTGNTGTKPSSCSAADKSASADCIATMAAEAAKRKAWSSKPLLPLDTKPLLQRVLGDQSTGMVEYEDKAFDPAKNELGQYRDRRYRDVEPLGDEPDIYGFKVGEEEYVVRKANKWNNVGRRAQLKARWSSGYIDSLLEGTPCRRQVIAQAMTPADFEARRVAALEALAAAAEADKRAAAGKGAPRPKAEKEDKKDKKKGGKGQQASGKAEAIKAEADKKRLEKVIQAKTDQLEHVKKTAPKDIKTELDALIKHLEELRLCSQRCVDDGAYVVAIEAELVGLRHVMDACKRDRKDELVQKRHVKRGFVIIQRILNTCRGNLSADAVREIADIAGCLGFKDLAKAVEDIGDEEGAGGDGDGKKKDKKEKKDKKDKKDDKKKDKDDDDGKKKRMVQLEEQSAIRYQVDRAAEYLRRPVGQADERVPFRPDDWQRRLLDVADSGNSALIVAPTASGKTFIAYYVMEMCLRANDTDVVIYVAPTGALVNQVHHEIQARFTKTYQGDMHLTGVFNTSYREDHTKCQILVTRPECLEIMLLDPANVEWAKNIRHVIFDEVHSVAMEGGEVWERMLLYVTAPVLALSATLGDMDKFHGWLDKVEKQRGRSLYFINHQERHNDLCPYIWSDRDTFDEQLVGMHPCWAIFAKLQDGQRFEFPSDFKLLPEHCVRLHVAMERHESSSRVKELSPEAYFQKIADPTFNISMRDARNWEVQIKDCFCSLSYDVQKKVLEEVVSDSNAACDHIERKLDAVSERDYLNTNMLPMLRTLEKASMLPAIVFHMTRDGCVLFALSIAAKLRQAEEVEQEKDGHGAKIEKQEKKVDLLNKQLEKMGWDKDTAGKDGEEPSDEQKEMMQDIMMAQAKLDKLKAVDPRFALIPPGQGQLHPSEIEEMVSTGGKKKFFQPSNPLHQALLRGVAAHHGGLPTNYLRAVERLFRMKRLCVVISTETLAMGINMPTKTSVFAGDSNFLNAMNYRQMAGRAGRRGFDLRGQIVFMGIRREKIKRLQNSELPTLSGNLLLTSTVSVRLLIKHSSIRTQQERDVIAQQKRYEGFIDKIEDGCKQIVEDYRERKSKTPAESRSVELSQMSHADRAREIVKSPPSTLEHINARDLAYALVEMAEKPRDERHMALESVLDDRNSKMKQVKDGVVDDVKIAIAAMKKLNDIVALSSAETPATIAEKERVDQIRAEDATACARLVNNPLFQPGGNLMSAQYALAFRFATEYLQKEGMMDSKAGPCDLACIVSLLFTCEPANFATVDILRSRYVEQIVQRYVEESDGTKTFNEKSAAQIMEHLVSIFAHLFGVVKLPKWHAEYLKANAAAKGPCSVILEPIDGKVREILEVHSKHAIEACTEYWRSFSRAFDKELGDDCMLPFTGCSWPAHGSYTYAPFEELSVAADVRSRFVSLSGHGDIGADFKSVGELCSSLRRGLVIDPKFLPVFQVDESPQNAYVLDFYREPTLSNIVRYNKISDNAVWQMLKDFAVVITGLQKSLERRCKYAPYKRGIHGEGRNLETVFSDPQTQEAFNGLRSNFAEKFNTLKQ